MAGLRFKPLYVVFGVLCYALCYLQLRSYNEAVQQGAAAGGAVDLASRHRQLRFVPDAFVLIAMGHTLVNKQVSTSVIAVAEACVCSLRATGGYNGDILLVTDDVEGMQDSDLVTHYGIKPIAYPYEFDQNDFDQVSVEFKTLVQAVNARCR